MLYSGILQILIYILLGCLYGIPYQEIQLVLFRSTCVCYFNRKLNHLVKPLNQVLYSFNWYSGNSHTASELDFGCPGSNFHICFSPSRLCGNTLKYAMNTFFSLSGLMMLSSKSSCLCAPFAEKEHLQI